MHIRRHKLVAKRILDRRQKETQRQEQQYCALDEMMYSLVGSALTHTTNQDDLHDKLFNVTITKKSFTILLALIQLCHDREKKSLGVWLKEITEPTAGGSKQQDQVEISNSLNAKLLECTTKVVENLMNELIGEKERIYEKNVHRLLQANNDSDTFFGNCMLSFMLQNWITGMLDGALTQSELACFLLTMLYQKIGYNTLTLRKMIVLFKDHDSITYPFIPQKKVFFRKEKEGSERLLENNMYSTKQKVCYNHVYPE